MNINDATDKTSGEETGNQVWSVDLAHGQPTAGDFPSAVIRAITGGGPFHRRISFTFQRVSC